MLEARKDLEESIRVLWGADDHQAALTVALDGYGYELFGFMVRVLGDSAEASEAFAQASTDMWTGLPRFRWESTFRTWAYAIARNACRRQASDPYARRRTPLSQHPWLDDVATRVRTSTLPHLKSEMKDRVADLRRHLSVDEQILLTLRIDRALSFEEIATVLADDSREDGQAAGGSKAAGTHRKRFERLKDRLRDLARKEGLL